MDVLFMGTPEFAVPSLRSLATSKHNIIAVVTRPDRSKGRSKLPRPSPVKEAAQKLGLEVLQPLNINEEPFVKQLQNFSLDCIVVVAFGQFLSSPIIHLPRYKCINIHASLLPKFRGAAPINWAIIRGETITGVTAVVMTVEMDAGDVITQKATPISPQEDAGELEKRLASMGADILIEALDLVEKGAATYTKQEEKGVTFAPKLKKEDGLIPWSQGSEKIYNMVRGLTPAPGAYAYYVKNNSEKRERIIILKTQIHDVPKTKSPFHPGMIVEIAPCGIHVATLDGLVCITRLQAEGKRAMDVQEYMRGHKMSACDRFVY